MIGIDTNVLVRFLTNDDKIQARQAAKLIESHSIFISKSVLLETEWVLRYTYEFAPDAILEAFKKCLGLSEITVEDPACVAKALRWYRHGLDFADALHLASNGKVEKFATFDKNFIQKTKNLQIHTIILMPFC